MRLGCLETIIFWTNETKHYKRFPTDTSRPEEGLTREEDSFTCTCGFVGAGQRGSKRVGGGIVTFRTGFAFSPEMGYDPTNTGSQGLLRTDRIGNRDLSHRSPTLWFNVNDFPVPSCYCFGNAGKNILEGPGEKSADLSARKFFEITDRLHLEFRAEFFNAFNHAVFAQPDSFITDGPGAAGVITSTVLPGRQIQFATKLQF
jgi:hypothetical protein